jgi:hypothetical protein
MKHDAEFTLRGQVAARAMGLQIQVLNATTIGEIARRLRHVGAEETEKWGKVIRAVGIKAE